MNSKLLAQCVYTIVEKNHLWDASRDQAPSDPITPRYSRHLWRAARTASRPRVKLASAELRLIAFG